MLPVNIDLPRVEDIGARVREAAWRVSRAGKRPDAIGNRREAPQAMGASQPVLTDQPAPEPYVLPANLGVDGN